MGNKFRFLTFLLTFMCGVTWSQDKMLDVLKSELQIQMEGLSKQQNAPYYMDFRVVDYSVDFIQSSFGATMEKVTDRNRYFMPHIRVGNNMLDNFYYTSQASNGKSSLARISIDDNETVIRNTIWGTVDKVYQNAKTMYSQTKAQSDVATKQEDTAPNFAKTKIETFYEEPLKGKEVEFDMEAWNKRVNAYSAKFNVDKNLIDGGAVVMFKKYRKYFVSSEGATVVQNETYALLQVSATIKAADGMELPLHLSYFAFTPDGLPSEQIVNKDIDDMILKLGQLRNAPVVTPYAGPALMSGSAAGVFFHEIFGHRVEGQRMKTDRDGQTFKAMVGKQLLPASISVFDDPTLKTYNGEALNGYFKYDEQGVKGRRVDVIKDGMLNEFLMSRTAINGFPESNGHGRADVGFDPTTRQSNLVVETKDHKSEADLRELLKQEMKKQGKDYGYFFKKVSAGLAFTGAGQVNSFNVTPLEVYKIYLDGRPDELVRGVDMIGTPLSIFENIAYGGGEHEVFTGTCGAESGGIPVTAIAPTMLITKVEVQLKTKNQNQPPILPKPESK